jgi:alcohol dehydrogenase
MIPPFDFHCPTRIVYGPGKIDELGPVAMALGFKRALVASDPGIVDAGHAARGIDSLKRFSISVELFDGIHENPTTADVEVGLKVAREFRPDVSMDCAKGINFLYSCGGRMQDYWGEGKATGPLLPMIAVPTTAGTGSETQSYALISDAETHVKMACGDKRAAFRVAILDPQLTTTQPPRVTALTGIDAISHAIESYVTRRRSAISLAFSREAWRHLAPNFTRVLAEPQNLEARGEMQLGACFAGLAIEKSMLGAAHALANPLTATFGVPHGEAVALMLPHVIRHNGQRVGGWYRELAQGGAPLNGSLTDETAANALADWVATIAREAGLNGTLKECEVRHEDVRALSAAASQQWTIKFNPVEVTVDDCQRLYEVAL